MTNKTLAALALVAFSGAALAAPPAFETVDTNSDGKITKEEVAVVEGLDFEAADANQDGTLDRAEYEAAAEAM